MKTLAVADIIIPIDRQRKERDAKHAAHIGDLMGSIFSETGAGLLNPITVRDGRVLVAGECRLESVTLGYKMGKKLRHAGLDVPEGEIPILDFGDLTLIARAEAEYVENAKRLNLSWQDNMAAVNALNGLMKLKAEAAGVVHTQVAVAKEIGSSPKHVSEQLAVARHMDNPLVAKAASFKEAIKVVGKLVDAEKRVKLAGEVGKTLVTERMQVFHANCVEWMSAQPKEQFDVILTDPPYGMGADGFGDAAGRLAGTTHEYEDSTNETVALLKSCIPEFYRLGKVESHLYLWCDIDLFHFIRQECEATGYWVHRTPLINIKREGGRVPWPEHGPRRCYEICLYAVKGKRPTTGIRPDVFESTLSEGNFGHGAQKPVESYVELLKRSVRPGDKILDAFAGTGTIFPAAAAVGCYAVGIEQEAAAYGICLTRIGELK